MYILNCLNGVLVLHQDRVEFMKHDPDLLLTQIANVRYEPGKSCERQEKFVDEVMEGNQEKVRYLQKLFGICLTGDTRACLKNHSRDLHSPLCGEFIPNLVNIAHYDS